MMLFFPFFPLYIYYSFFSCFSKFIPLSYRSNNILEIYCRGSHIVMIHQPIHVLLFSSWQAHLIFIKSVGRLYQFKNTFNIVRVSNCYKQSYILYVASFCMGFYSCTQYFFAQKSDSWANLKSIQCQLYHPNI